MIDTHGKLWMEAEKAGPRLLAQMLFTCMISPGMEGNVLKKRKKQPKNRQKKKKKLNVASDWY